MANLIPKVSADKWLDVACRFLVRDGINGVKIDAMARDLDVSRGGFYHHFKNRADLLDRLLAHWEKSNIFFDPPAAQITPEEARRAFLDGFRTLIAQSRFDPDYDLAVRDWAKTDKTARAAVERVDIARTQVFLDLFLALGNSARDAKLRAELLYMHQMGIYLTRTHRRHSARERMQNFVPYMSLLTGETYDLPALL